MKFKFSIVIVLSVLCCACSRGRADVSSSGEGDTLVFKYAKHIRVIRHPAYTEVQLADPWNTGKTLHTYLLVGREATLPDGLPRGTVVRTPLQKSVIATSVHCGLVEQLGRPDAIQGVCDLQYIHLPWIQEGCRQGTITDCGSALQPTLEKIIDLQPDAIFLSPFQNSGGYGRLEELRIPIVETADYMETSALGRAEWMRFYGMLFGAEREADSLFASVEQNYLALKAQARQGSQGGKRKTPTVLMDKLTGSVWYVPGGQSTIGRMLVDAGASYPWSANENSGSLPLPFETILEKGAQADVWLFRYNSPHPITSRELLSEHKGYSQFRAFRQLEIYGCNTATSTFYEETPFHPDLLLRDFITILHPEINLGEPRYFLKAKE